MTNSDEVKILIVCDKIANPRTQTERLVNDNSIHNIRSNSQPIPANRLARKFQYFLLQPNS